MDYATVESKLKQAAVNLFTHQPGLSHFVSASSNQTEWNISHHLANEISALFEGYDCDIDISKSNFKNKRPDIIIHQRGNNDDNLLVIEVKRTETSTETEREKDIQKIKDNWFQFPLFYKYGAIIVTNNYGFEEIKFMKNETKSLS